MRYGFGCDHAGIDFKELLVRELEGAGHEVVDMGTFTRERTDFPIYANKVAQAVSEGTLDLGVLVCGTGLGMAVAASRYPGIRAVTVSDCFSARMARRHTDANILCLGARVLGEGAALEVLRAWLSAEFEGGRYEQRLQMMRGGYKGTSLEAAGS
ncbi:MAG TPA: ribose 5-phosphate isomerase B [Thermoleophilia bacterium]